MLNKTPTTMTNHQVGTAYGRVIRKRQSLGGVIMTLEGFKQLLAKQIEQGAITRDDANEQYKWAKEESK